MEVFDLNVVDVILFRFETNDQHVLRTIGYFQLVSLSCFVEAANQLFNFERNLYIYALVLTYNEKQGEGILVGKPNWD
jgi:hypothetical protein